MGGARPEAFLALWHPDGILRSPLYDRPVAGKELGRLTELVKHTAPDHVWQLLDWTARGEVVIVEWQATRTAGGQRIDWRGVDKFRLRDGRIAEETVYMDTVGAAGRARRPCGRSRSFAWATETQQCIDVQLGMRATACGRGVVCWTRE